MSNENEEPFALNQKNIKNDMLHFKNEMLKDLKNMQKTITEKFDISNSVLKDKLESYDRKLNLFNDKIIQISNLVATDNNLKEKTDKLFQTNADLRDHILTNEIKFSNLEKDFQERVTKIEYVLSDSVIYPSVIGPKGKYKTFHEFMDYLLFQMNQNIVYREKNALDVTTYKNKLENISQSLKMQVDNIIKNTNQFTTKSVNECEERIKNIIALYDDRLTDVRVDNQNYIKNLELFYQDLKEDCKRLSNMKSNIYNRFNQEVYNMKKDNIQVVKLFGNYKKEFNVMKDKLTKLSEFIKDVRFRINIGQEIKRREFFNMANRIDFSKKSDVMSGIKKYIKGEINAEQLAASKPAKSTFGSFSYNTNTNTTNINNMNNNINNSMSNNLNNNINYNVDDDINNDDSMNSINYYLMRNKNFFESEDSNFRILSQSKPRQSMIPDLDDNSRRKSVSTLISINKTFKKLKSSPLINIQQNSNIFHKTINNSNSDFRKNELNLNFVNNDKRDAQSSEIIGRKRYQSVFSKNNNNNFFNNFQGKININVNTIKKGMDSEDSKTSNESPSAKNKNIQNYNKNIIIKEEEETNSKISDNESNKSNNNKSNNNKSKNISIEANSISTQKNNNFNGDKNINQKKRNSNSEKNIINKLNQNNLDKIPIKSKQIINFDLNKKMISHSNININTLKNLKESQTINSNNTKNSDRKPNNNIVIDCRTNQNLNVNQNKSPIIINNNKNNDMINIKKYNNSNNNKDTSKTIQFIKKNNEETSKVEIIDERIAQISVHSQTKNNNINNIKIININNKIIITLKILTTGIIIIIIIIIIKMICNYLKQLIVIILKKKKTIIIKKEIKMIQQIIHLEQIINHLKVKNMKASIN